MRKNGVPFDPTNWLKKHNGGGGKKAPSKWKGTIKKAAKKMKVNLSGSELNGIVKQIARESNGDAGVTQGNIGDINNRRGTPAQGLLQYVPSTFKSYAVKGHTNIKSGYDQLLAFFNNKNWRKDLPYGRSGWGPTGGRRFAKGTNFAPRGWAQVHEKGGEIMNLRGGEQIIPHDVSVKALSNLLSSELFNRTQNAVYNGITSYAEQLRRQDIQRQKQQTQQNNNNANSNDIAEMKSMFNDMLYLMQKMVGASEETARNTDGILNKNDSNQQNSYEDLSRQLGFDYVMSNYNTGSRV